MALSDGPLQPDEVVNTIRQALRARGVRWTDQREHIIRIFAEQSDHLTVDELLVRVRKADSSVSLTTLYRTLNVLVEAGFATKRNFNSASASFELTMGKDHHHHLIDTRDGQVIEFNDPELEAVLQRVAGQLGYRISCHRLELFGVPLEDASKRRRR